MLLKLIERDGIDFMMSSKSKIISLGVLSTSIGSSGGGVSSLIREQVSRLQADISPTIFSSDIDTPINIPNTTSIIYSRAYFKGKFLYFPNMKNQVTDFKPDLIHQHGIWNYLSIVANKTTSTLQCPLIISPHGMLEEWIVSRKQYQKKILRQLFQNRNFNRATVFHALTEKEVEDIRRIGFRGDIAIIPNGIEVKHTCVKVDVQKQLKAVYLGRLHPKKRVLELIKAASLLCIEGFPIELDIYGWGDENYTNQVKCLAQANNNIVFHGPIYDEKKYKALRDSDLFVLPSLSEGLPMAILEAWSVGTPTLHSEYCNLSIGFKKGASLVTSPDTNSIKQGLKKYISLSL